MNEFLISVFSLGGIGLAFGVILSILDKKLKVEQDPKVKEVLKILPGINCGTCGFAGCAAFAEEVVRKKNLFKGCIPGGEEVNRKIVSLLGVEAKSFSSFKVVVFCGAKTKEKKSSFDYKGPKTCFLANIGLGNIDCRFGCLGFGDCVEVCPTSALKIEEKCVVVDYNKCIGCGKCVEACPRGLLRLMEANRQSLYVVSCNNPEDRISTKEVCSKGCIGCGLCTKIIKDSPFYLERGLSRIEYKKLKDKSEEELDKAVSKCPTKIINKFSL